MLKDGEEEKELKKSGMQNMRDPIESNRGMNRIGRDNNLNNRSHRAHDNTLLITIMIQFNSIIEKVYRLKSHVIIITVLIIICGMIPVQIVRAADPPTFTFTNSSDGTGLSIDPTLLPDPDSTSTTSGGELDIIWRRWDEINRMPNGTDKDTALANFRKQYGAVPGDSDWDPSKAGWFSAHQAQQAESSGGGNILVDFILGRVVAIIGVVLGLLLGIVSLFFKIVFNMIVLTLMKVLEFNNFTGLPQIDQVWKATRDLSNMFFIVILLVIAFGTMLRIEKYNYKQLLPKLLIMAVLINFSRTIAGFIIDVSQVVMLTFYASMKEAGVGNFQNMFAVTADIFKFGISSISEIAGTSYEGPMLVVVAMVMTFMYLVTGTSVMFTILGMLIFRIVALWVLVMVSPLAFFLSTFPQGEEYSGMWWKQFSSNVLIGPALAFFLWLALLLNETTNYTEGKEAGPATSFFKDAASLMNSANFSDVVQGLNAGGGSLANTFAGSFSIMKFLNILLSLTILSVGMMIAQQIGSAGGKMVGDWAGKINDWGMASWQKPAQFMAEGFRDFGDRKLAGLSTSDNKLLRAFSWLSPTRATMGYQKYVQRRDSEAFKVPVATFADMLHLRASATLGVARDKDGFVRESWKNMAEMVGKVLGENAKNMMLSEGAVGRVAMEGDIEHEAEVRHYQSEIDQQDMTGEEKAKYFLRAKGTGNIYQIEALMRSLISGNNQDDLAGFMKQLEGTDFLSDIEGRLGRRKEQKAGRDFKILSDKVNVVKTQEELQKAKSRRVLNPDAANEEPNTTEEDRKVRQHSEYAKKVEEANSKNDVVGQRSVVENTKQELEELKQSQFANPEAIKALEKFIEDFGSIIEEGSSKYEAAAKKHQDAEAEVAKAMKARGTGTNTFADWNRLLRQGRSPDQVTQFGDLHRKASGIEKTPIRYTGGSFIYEKDAGSKTLTREEYNQIVERTFEEAEQRSGFKPRPLDKNPRAL